MQRGRDRDRDDRGHEPRRHAVREVLYRSARPLRLGHEPHDRSEKCVAPDALRLHHECPRAVHRSRHDAASGQFFDGDRLARDRRLVDGALAFLDDAVDRHPLSRTHAKAIGHHHLLERHVLLVSVRADPARGLRSEREKRSESARGLSSRAELEDLPEEHQGHDDRRRLEVDRNRSRVMVAERVGEDSGKNVATTLDRYAAPVPSAMSVNMLRLRFAIDFAPRSKKGYPPQRTTGVERRN